jgi:ribosome-associated protein
MAKPEIEHPDDLGTERPSKSRLKRDAQGLQDLGSELLQLSEEQLGRLELPTELSEAIGLGRSLKDDGSLKRQRKYIGKLLRQVDSEPIRSRIEELTRASASATRALHQVEAWRERLLIEGDAAIGELMAEYPEADRPKLRGLIEAARTERLREQPPRAARLLFRYLRELLPSD